jgi:hypothetical protein
VLYEKVAALSAEAEAPPGSLAPVMGYSFRIGVPSTPAEWRVPTCVSSWFCAIHETDNPVYPFVPGDLAVGRGPQSAQTTMPATPTAIEMHVRYKDTPKNVTITVGPMMS